MMVMMMVMICAHAGTKHPDTRIKATYVQVDVGHVLITGEWGIRITQNADSSP